MISLGRLLQFVIVAGLVTFSAWEVSAQGANYRFTVSKMELQVYVLPDASAKLVYNIEFKNSPGAHSIDIVDIGLPHGGYDLSTMKASVDGQALSIIRRSTYISTGVEVHLEVNQIPAGQTGRFMFECIMPDMVYRDTTDKQYASLQIMPTYFDPSAQEGQTQLSVAIHLLPGVNAQEVKYQNDKNKYTDLVLFGDGQEKHPVAIWQYESIYLSAANPKLAISFPSTGMQRVVKINAWGLFMKWFRENPRARLVSMGAALLLFAFTFFRFSHGTGIVLFLMLAAVQAVLCYSFAGLNLLAWPVVIGLTVLNEWALKRRKRSADYLPAMATVEGGGIKRGLTAPQAAVLLEVPMGKILTLVIFGLMRKGIVQKVQDDPLQVKVLPEYVGSQEERLRKAADAGQILHDYEHAFVDGLESCQGPVQTCDLNKALGGLIQSVVKRMAGFDLKETKAYYQAIIARACKEAESLGEVQQRDEVVDRNFEWILMDENWIDFFERLARRGYRYRPRWDRPDWRGRPGGSGVGPVIVINNGGLGGGGVGAPSGGGSGSSEVPGGTSLKEVAASFAGWTENTMASLASAIEPAKLGSGGGNSGGILDLSAIDRVTADVFEALAKEAAKGGRGGSGGRGGGGGCACACAGCACACACAGGGR